MAPSLDLVDWPVRSERLVLRRLADGDLPRIFGYRSQPDVARWIGGAAIDIDSLSERFGDGATAVVVEHDGWLIGDLMVSIQDAFAQREVADGAEGTEAELGWTFDPSHHGRGLATEAIRTLLGICFGALGLHRVVASCFVPNEPSWRLMERVGMRREAHHVKNSLHRDLGWQDEYVYALLRDEHRPGDARLG